MGYKRKTAAPPPLRFEVETAEGSVTVEARHLLFHEFSGLADVTIGEVEEGADVTGRKYLRERVLKLSRVVLSVEGYDPDDEEGQAAIAARAWERLFALPGNENLAWKTWNGYVEALEGTLSKSGPSDRREGAGEGRGADGPQGEPDAHLRAVRAADAGGSEPSESLLAAPN
jgi:hypothetical protein